MKTMAITEFKAHALQVLGQISETKVPIIITKRGKPLAEIIPFSSNKAESGKMSDALLFEKDIISPLGDDIWKACK